MIQMSKFLMYYVYCFQCSNPFAQNNWIYSKCNFRNGNIFTWFPKCILQSFSKKKKLEDEAHCFKRSFQFSPTLWVRKCPSVGKGVNFQAAYSKQCRPAKCRSKHDINKKLEAYESDFCFVMLNMLCLPRMKPLVFMGDSCVSV